MANKNETQAQNTNEAVHTGYGEASAAEVKEILKIAYAAGMSVIIYGEPGVGKTSIVSQFAKDLGGMEVLVGSQLDSCDFSGLPQSSSMEIDGRSVKTTVFGAPDWQVRLMNGTSKVLFLDEFSNSPASIQAAELKLVGDRRFANGDKVPDDVFIILATNPVESSVDAGSMLAPPMASRLLQISMRPTPKEVYNGLVHGWDEEPWDDKISEDEMKWRRRIVDWLKSTNGTYIVKRIDDTMFNSSESSLPAWMHPDSEASESEREILQTAWPCPRSWDNVCRLLGHTGFAAEVSPLQERILAGTVGRQCAVYICDYAHSHSTISPYEAILKPEKQEWRVSKDGVQYNSVLELARAINEAVPTCTGMNGTPTLEQALDFYSKVIDLGGGAHFATAFCTGTGENSPRQYFDEHRPSNVTQRDWTRKIQETLRKYKDHGLIPDRRIAEN